MLARASTVCALELTLARESRSCSNRPCSSRMCLDPFRMYLNPSRTACVELGARIFVKYTHTHTNYSYSWRHVMGLWNMGKWTTPVPRRSLPERATSNKCCLNAEDIRRLEARADRLDVLLSIHRVYISRSWVRCLLRAKIKGPWRHSG